jgi:tetratricopeptide (TPR) repeat protein
MTGSPETSASMKVRWLALALAVGTFVLYSPAIWYDFVDYDDWMYVFKNQAVLAGLNLQGLHYAFTSFDGGSWMPLTWLSLMLDTTLFGARPEALHFTSLLLHSLTSGLLLVAMYRFTGNVWLSVVAIGIFALHPLRTESVVWIAERKDVLSGCCFALGLLAYKNYVNGPTPRRYGWVVGCLVLGLMSKPMLVTLPFVFLLLDFWPLRRMGDNWSAMRVKIWPLVCEKLPLFILIIASCVFTYWSQKQTGAMSRWSTDLLGRAGDVAGNYGFYLFKLVLPINRTVIYPQIHLAFPVLLLLGTGLIAMTVGVLWKAFRWPWLTVGWFWFLGMLVPVIGIVPVGMTPVADRYTYLPSIGIGIALAWSVSALVQGRIRAKQVACGFGMAVLASLIWMTSRDLPRWQNSRALFESAIRVAPHKIAYNNLAYFCLRQGEYGEAIELATRAIELDPNYGASYSSRAMAYVCQDNYARAKTDYDHGIRLGDRPLRSNPNYNPMAIAGTDPEEDWEQFTTAIGMSPRTAEDFQARAASRVKRMAMDLAIADYSKAIELKPDFADAYCGRASVCNATGDLHGAIRDASQAIELNTNHGEAYLARAVAYTRLSNYFAALQDNDKTIQLSPTNVLAHQNRAVTYFLMKDFDAAWKDVERCRRLGGKPPDSFVRALSAASGRTP